MTETNPPAVWWSPEYQRFYALTGTPPLVEEVETRFMPSDIQPMSPDTEQAPTCGCGYDNPAVACVEELHETAQSGYQRGYRHATELADRAAVPDTEQAREIHNLLSQLAARSTSPDVLDSATEHVVRTNVRNGRPTSARFVGLVLAELDQARATQSSGETVQAPPAEIAGWDGAA